MFDSLCQSEVDSSPLNRGIKCPFALALRTLVLFKQRVKMVHALESTKQSFQCKTLLKQPKTKKTVSEFN